MKKNRLLSFALMNLANYVLVLLACTLYGVGFGTALLFFVLQPILTAANYTVSKKTWQLIVLSAHQLISTTIANCTSVQLYYQNISSDSETLLVGKYAFIIGCVYVIILSVIAIGIKPARSLSQRKQEPTPVKQPSVMRTLIAVISVILPVLLLGSLVYTAFLGLPVPTFKQVTVSADNAYRNNTRCEAINNIAGGQGALYIDAENRLPFGGVYRLDGGFVRRIYTYGWDNTDVPFSKYIYRGNPVQAEAGAIHCLRTSEPFLNPPLKNGDKVESVFVTGEELYYYTEQGKNTIYHYVDDVTVDVAASEKLCGNGYTPVDFCGNTMYYSLKSQKKTQAVPNDYEAELDDCGIRKLYQYDLKSRKTVRCIDFSCLDKELPKKNSALKDYFITDNCVYLFVDYMGKLEEYYTKEIIENDAMLQDIGYAEITKVYRFEIKTQKLTHLTDFDNGSFTVNGYGDKVYLSTVTENYKNDIGSIVELENILYVFSDHSDKPTLLPVNESIGNLYIFDKEWLYYTTSTDSLYRIHPDGSHKEHIF